jgi:hypothetical protein
MLDSAVTQASTATSTSRVIDADRHPLSPRIRALKGILNKVEPPPVREPLPPRKM